MKLGILNTTFLLETLYLIYADYQAIKSIYSNNYFLTDLIIDSGDCLYEA